MARRFAVERLAGMCCGAVASRSARRMAIQTSEHENRSDSYISRARRRGLEDAKPAFRVEHEVDVEVLKVREFVSIEVEPT
jgi:hypothetical protein